MSVAAPEVWVVVCSYGAPPSLLREDGTRYPPIVMETYVDKATRENAMKHAADMERRGYGACRIARVVFEDEPAPSAST